MYLRLVIIAGLLSGLQMILFIQLFVLDSWKVIASLLLINFITLTITSGWLKQASVDEQEENNEHLASYDPTLKIANETLPILRGGLTEQSAHKTAEIIQKIADVPAVAVTNKEQVLSYLGAGCEMHQPGDKILTEATKEVIKSGQHKVVQTAKQLNCPVENCDCPLAAAVIVPLKNKGEVVGTLKLYQTQDGQLPPHTIRLAIGIGQLLSMQIELSELDRQTQLLTMAKLDALHAQINPHFFFNTLNTIIMYSRTNPDRARRLLIRLAEFFRQTLKRHGHFITLREELECVNTYLVLEKARFGDKLQIIEEVDESLMNYKLPVLSIQPLIENAVKHGVTPKVGTGAVKVTARKEINELVLSVVDDGVGIPADKLQQVLQPGVGSGNGVGMSNVHERIKTLFGEDYGLKIVSYPDQGTSIEMRIPLLINEEETVERGGLNYYEAESAHR
ncbi:histidine kinase [Metallumcola ferriviriculae]|uniref:histidine kinase n=1 Tax=Metallumcola ferriviriculae TaxID=3039180 RepID=A0AAU0USL2_9FIRM|nr:histidine kinase [Desulfitibacteraceae bacterium MK1]